MSGIIGRKLGMTSIFITDGPSVKQIACTVIEAGPCVVTQVKTVEKEGYSAVQLSYGEKKEKNVSKQMVGHFKKAQTTPKQKSIEFKKFEKEFTLGDLVLAKDVFTEGETINVIGTSKGKGFQGVVKRHGFSGVGGSTHGQHNRLRHPGSVGASSYPSRVFKGLRMAGRTGSDRVKLQNLKVVKVLGDQNLVLVSGAIPGAKNSFVILEK